MKKFLIHSFAFLLTIHLISCTKEDSNIEEPDVEQNGGAIVPPGLPDSSAIVKATIGAAGGTLASADGSIKLEIPAGALSESTEVSIKRITNTNPLGIKKGYRLEPHNVEFKKPARIIFSYIDEDIEGTVAEALGVAYQDDKGVWKAMGNAQLDKANKEISVNTNHFSDWTFFESLYVVPGNTTIEPGGNVELKLVCDEKLLASLVPGLEYDLTNPQPIPASYVKKWTLSGAGALEGKGATAVYKAPASVPNPNPVVISVEVDLGQKGKYLVVAHVTIASSQIEFQLGNSAVIKIPASPVVRFGNDYLLANPDNEGGGYFLLRWSGGIGNHSYKLDNTGGHFHWLNGPDFVNYYLEEDKIVISGGSINITSMGEKDGYVEGTFTVSPSGSGKPFPQRSVDVKGKFRAKKAF